MNFDLSDEQQQLRDAVDRFVRGSYGFELRKSVLKSADGFDAKVWSGLAELGLLGLLVPEAHGGLAQGPIETALAMQAAGPALLVEPWLDVAVTATVLLNALGDDAASAALLPAIASGERLVVVAHQEAAGRGEVAFVEMGVQAKGGDFVLNGRKAVVPGAGIARPGAPTRADAGSLTSVNMSSAARRPSMVAQPRTCTPVVPRATRNTDTPGVAAASPESRALTSHSCATPAPGTTALRPLSTKSPPFA